MTIGMIAVVLMAHFALFLGSLAFPNYTKCTPADLAACAGNEDLTLESLATEVRQERQGVTGIGFIDKAVDFVKDMWESATGVVTTLFGLFTFDYRILNEPEGSIGSGIVSLMVLAFRLALTVTQAYVIWRMTMMALGRG